jgi:hypothetical protein
MTGDRGAGTVHFRTWNKELPFRLGIKALTSSTAKFSLRLFKSSNFFVESPDAAK